VLRSAISNHCPFNPCIGLCPDPPFSFFGLGVVNRCIVSCVCKVCMMRSRNHMTGCAGTRNYVHDEVYVHDEI
jgi:hypothetical protein